MVRVFRRSLAEPHIVGIPVLSSRLCLPLSPCGSVRVCTPWALNQILAIARPIVQIFHSTTGSVKGGRLASNWYYSGFRRWCERVTLGAAAGRGRLCRHRRLLGPDGRRRGAHPRSLDANARRDYPTSIAPVPRKG